MSTLPVLFLSHGPPAIALSDWPVARFLRGLAPLLPSAHAVLCVSAHWETVAPQLTDASRGSLIYDFDGPAPLFDCVYRPPNAADWMERVAEALHEQRLSATFVPERGLDHGVWVPLSLIYPRAQLPIIQLSLQTASQAAHHVAVGASLAPLRREGLLIVGSGGAVHNLDEMAPGAAQVPPRPFVLAFDAWLEAAITAGDLDALMDYQRQAPSPQRSHPYPAEHFLPLLVAASAAEGAPGRLLHRSFLYETLSLAAYCWE